MLKIFILSLLVLANRTNDSFLGVECFPKEGIIKASVRLKYADFIFDYRYAINDDQQFGPSGEIDTTKILVSQYLDKRIQIFADGKKLRVKLMAIESADDELRLDLLYYYNKRAKLFKVKNMMISEYNENQSNHLIFKYKDFEQGVTLTPKKMEETFKVK
jgi:hypothetical protein